MKRYLTLSFLWPLMFALGFLYITVKYGYFFISDNSAWLDLTFGLLFLAVFGLLTWLWFKVAFANVKKKK